MVEVNTVRVLLNCPENSLIIFKNVTNTQHVYFEVGVYIEKNDVPKSVSDNTQLN